MNIVLDSSKLLCLSLIYASDRWKSTQTPHCDNQYLLNIICYQIVDILIYFVNTDSFVYVCKHRCIVCEMKITLTTRSNFMKS